MTDRGDERAVVGLVSASHFFNHAYLMLVPAVIGAAASTFHVSLTTVGLAVGLQGAMMAAFQLPFGYLADVRSRELVFGACLGLGALGAVVIALAPSLGWLFVGEAIIGVGIAGHHPAHYPMLGDAVASDRRGRAFSVHGLAGNVGFAVPFALAPAVVALGGDWQTYVGAFAVAGTAFAVVALLALRWRVSPDVRVPEADPEGSLRAQFLEMLRGVRDPAIVSLAVFAGLASGTGWAIRTYTASLLGVVYGVPSARASLLVSAMIGVAAVVILAGGVLADRSPPGRVLVGGFVLLAAASLVLAGAWLPALAASVLVLAYYAALTVTTPSRSKITDRLSARGDVGKNFALVTVGISGGTTVAPPVFGYLVESFGPQFAFYGVALGALVAAQHDRGAHVDRAVEEGDRRGPVLGQPEDLAPQLGAAVGRGHDLAQAVDVEAAAGDLLEVGDQGLVLLDEPIDDGV